MRVLLTAFGPFGGIRVNPSQVVLEHLARSTGIGDRMDLIPAVLRTEFDSAGERILELIGQLNPDAVVSLGVAAGVGAISLERVALNLDDGGLEDNLGDARWARPIAPGGPIAYWSTLPLAEMYAALEAHSIPARISNHAGTYVCNHVFYVARHAIELLGSSARCGFIHLPLIEEEGGRREGRGGLSLRCMLEAIQCCLGVLAEGP